MSASAVLVTFLWRGWRPVYDKRHVNVLYRMLAEHSPGLRLVCVTDRPQGIECETFPLWESPVQLPSGRRNCFTRLRLFDPATVRQFAGVETHVANIDLDCVVLGDLKPLLSEIVDFKAMLGVRAPINGSLWMVRIGAHKGVWTDFHPTRSLLQIQRAIYQKQHLVGSDQAWMSLKIKNPPTWWVNDGVQQFSHYDASSSTKVLFFAGSTKPWEDNWRPRCPQAWDMYQKHWRKACAQ